MIFWPPTVTSPELDGINPERQRSSVVLPTRRAASAAVYLASPAGAFVTGHNLVVDGGTTIGD